MGWWPQFEFDVNGQVSFVSEYMLGIWTLNKMLTYSRLISKWIAMAKTYFSSCFLWISLQSSPLPLLQTSSYKNHSTEFHSRPFSTCFWNILPEPPHSVIWLPSICLGCMLVVYTAFSSPPDPHIQLLTDWTPPFGQHAQKSTKHLKICFSSKAFGVTNYPGIQATQLSLILDFFLCPLIPAIRTLSVKCPKYF